MRKFFASMFLAMLIMGTAGLALLIGVVAARGPSVVLGSIFGPERSADNVFDIMADMDEGFDLPLYYRNLPVENQFEWQPEDAAHDEPTIPYVAPLPEPIAITPLNSLSMSNIERSLELPVIGATGWAGAYTGLFLEHPDLYVPSEIPVQIYDLYPQDYDLYLQDEDYEEEPPELYLDGQRPIKILSPGELFLILQEKGKWWLVRMWDGYEGWVSSNACFINLPDVVPSIVYNITNASGSVMVSGGFAIPGVTGISLYRSSEFNYRFGRTMYIVPALYATAKRLFGVQQAALARGETLVVYEVFRPLTTQRHVANSLNSLMRENDYVNYALNADPWNPTWFIASGVSSHQRGAAVDASLARVVSYGNFFTACNVYEYRRVLEYVMHHMPTPMHDLHPSAATFEEPGSNVFADTMTEAAKVMQALFARHDFTPLASEWWHFNDMGGVEVARALDMTGNFYTEWILSMPPSLVD